MRSEFEITRSALAEYRVRVSICDEPPVSYELLPDCIFESIEGPIKWTETFDEQGRHHSYLGEPSITAQDMATGKIFLKCRHHHGLLHSNDDLPSIDGLRWGFNSRVREWHDFGVPHRDENNGPAEIRELLHNNVRTLERYKKQGQGYCTFGPWCIQRSEDNGKILSQDFSDYTIKEKYNKDLT